MTSLRARLAGAALWVMDIVKLAIGGVVDVAPVSDRLATDEGARCFMPASRVVGPNQRVTGVGRALLAIGGPRTRIVGSLVSGTDTSTTFVPSTWWQLQGLAPVPVL